MNYFEQLRSGVTEEPTITTDSGGTFVIIGSLDHGMQIPQSGALKLVQVLDGVSALKMEGDEKQVGMFKERFHPMSAEMLAIACVQPSRLSWLAESDGEDIGQKLLSFGVPKEIMEVFVPSLNMRMNGGVSEDFFRTLPLMFEHYKQRFGFLNTAQGIETFLKVGQYFMDQRIDPRGLEDFSYDFEMFMGNVREFEYWRPDLKRFRAGNQGRIAVCCGTYHVDFVRSVFEGKEVEKPDWSNHIDKNNDPFVVKHRYKLKEIYKNLEAALNSTTPNQN
ncbi:hypothetical protein HYU94_03995 [Candidatus Daviesbacteria bacterium]|nr:hypothetical protein [Candidatus Daviesbacteria bacterium]